MKPRATTPCPAWRQSRLHAIHERCRLRFPDSLEFAFSRYIERKANSLYRLRQCLLGTAAEEIIRTAWRYEGDIPASFGFLPDGVSEFGDALIAPFWKEEECGDEVLPDGGVSGVLVVPLRRADAGRIVAEPAIPLQAPNQFEPVIIAEADDSKLAIAPSLADALMVHAAAPAVTVWAAAYPGIMEELENAVPGGIQSVTIFAHHGDVDERSAAEELRRDLLDRREPPAVTLYEFVGCDNNKGGAA